ncbi:MAG: cyclase family protein [Bacteroidales bacterium]|nr:cyclase family protein [Bacteroidales bacterium]MCF8344708.1 cyclase family protein [Bacteroidales bacterium]MCF8349783.1 cyclase family protein [Bacteroidales bacterium]MCF8376302.1 cyclase family protein [Bacteroidales bacterium]MCF8400996.1 cyclase family protein [Bacteroidales bacterium]
MNWIDISVSISPDLVVWPGDPPVRIEMVNDMDLGHEANLSRLNISAHTGTHMDAPSHFVKDGLSLDKMPLEVGVGKARVIGLEDRYSIKVDELRRHDIRKGDRILFKTKNSDTVWPEKPFMYDFVHLETEAAKYLAEKRILLCGIDYLSVSGINKNETQVHRALLEAGIWVIEGLFLKDVETGDYEMVCLPVKIKSSDGAPARVLIRKMKASE